MSNDIKNLTGYLIQRIFNYNAPSPTNADPQKCNTCENFTTLWYTAYPKNKSIVYRCDQCKSKVDQDKKINNADLG